VHDALITSVDEELMPLFTKYVSQRRAFMKHTSEVTNNQATPSGSMFDYDGVTYSISMRGEHQTTNAALAIETIHYLIKQKQYRVEQTHITQGLKKHSGPVD
jgi:UDP-N-acetylmuramyl pentapeptide synthase